MSIRNTPLAVHEYFHVYNRGNSKQNIFVHSSDYQRFLILLHLSNTSQQFNVRDLLKSNEDIFATERPDTLVKIGAYCLMQNHYHLILSPVTEGGVSRFMQKLGTAYSMYFNTKYERTGSLFEGRFKTKHVDYDEYMKYLFSYIHLNPIIDKNNPQNSQNKTYSQSAFEKAATYPYSSLGAYLSPRPGLGLVDTDVYGMYFKDAVNIKHEILDWLQYEEPALGRA